MSSKTWLVCSKVAYSKVESSLNQKENLAIKFVKENYMIEVEKGTLSIASIAQWCSTQHHVLIAETWYVCWTKAKCVLKNTRTEPFFES